MHGCCEPKWRNFSDLMNIFCQDPHFRHFKTKKEIKETLEKYKEELKREIEGIDERISELSKKE